MSSSLNIYPFENTEGAIRFAIQIVIFLVGLFLANKLIIKPALRLHNERIKRTTGSSDEAKKISEHATQLEHEYFDSLKKGADEAKNLRALEIKNAQTNANKLISENQEKAAQFVQSVKNQLAVEMFEAKKQLPNQLSEIMQVIHKKVGLICLLALAFGSTFYTPSAHAQSSSFWNLFQLNTDDGVLIKSFWYSIFWPYFQFAVFVVAIVYFAKKPITNMLSSRRDDLRARLSEAHQAVALAERKVKEYEAKVASLNQAIEELKQQNLFDAKIESEKIILEAQKISESLMRDSSRAAQELITQNKEQIRQELFSMAIEEFKKGLTPDYLSTLSKKLKEDVIDGIKSIH